MLGVLDMRLRDLSSPDICDSGTCGIADTALLEKEEAMAGRDRASRRRARAEFMVDVLR